MTLGLIHSLNTHGSIHDIKYTVNPGLTSDILSNFFIYFDSTSRCVATTFQGKIFSP